ncbi:MAG TPA: pilus assembly protein PilP [Polyangiaceae bacterium]
MLALAGVFAASILVVACGDKPKPIATIPTQTASSAAPPSASARQAALAAASDAGVDLPPLKPIEVTENDFVESDRNRDPFRSFASAFVAQGPTPAAANQRTVLLNDYSLDELKLVAIVLSGDYPRAMLVDPTGKGWVVKRGDFVGRADIVRLGGANGAEYQLNWRVDRVRDGDVVLIREDPAQPAIPPATKVVPLHTEKDEQAKNP